MLDRQEKMRADEWAKREMRIKQSMDRMGDVIRKNNDADRKFEEQLLRDALQKDKENELKEKKMKEQAKQRDLNLIAELNEQIKDKQRQREREVEQNEQYIKMVIDQDERDKIN